MNEKKRRTAKVLIIIAFWAAVSPHFSPAIYFNAESARAPL